MKRSATDIDVVIGQRMRAVRLERGMSQSDVATALGVTFQQLQKYERGKNRVSAAMLMTLTEIYEVDLKQLLPIADVHPQSHSLKVLDSAEASKLLMLFTRLKKPAHRAAVLAVCATLVGME